MQEKAAIIWFSVHCLWSFKLTLCLPLAAVYVGVGVRLLVDAEDAVDGVRGVPQLRGVVAESEPGPGADLRHGARAAAAAVPADLRLLCRLVTHDPDMEIL